uniref:FI15228p1 n=2 Tax=Drosophila melanogaster TaxID=7227 RepID=E2QDA1_DROME|eukprot:NP_652406.1 karr [Drosophila melanogaster]
MAEKSNADAKASKNNKYMTSEDPEQPSESSTQKEKGSQSSESEEEYFKNVSERFDKDIKDLKDLIALNEKECNRLLFDRLLDVIRVEIEEKLHLPKK